MVAIKNDIESMKQKYPNWVTPTLCIVSIDPQKATETYLRHKKDAANRIGIHFREERFDKNITQEQLVAKIIALGQDSSIHGIIIQLPLPAHLNTWEVVQTVPPEKDVDGLHAFNQGRIQLGLSCLIPCTPQGVMELLFHYKLLDKKGQHAVVLGRSPLVGKPIANLLLGREGNCIVTVLHRNTPDLSVFTKTADIIVSAVGQAGLVTPDMVKPGVIIIDVGINFIPSQTSSSGRKMVGDVDPAVFPKTSAYTPVPGGVGPMTVSMLMRNLVVASQRLQGIPEMDGGWRNFAREN
jgi:methylenetetrahydrofolate dehydrogenase (NADP+)/methenyltetrahydrofolate cyclohydrolase